MYKRRFHHARPHHNAGPLFRVIVSTDFLTEAVNITLDKDRSLKCPSNSTRRLEVFV